MLRKMHRNPTATPRWPRKSAHRVSKSTRHRHQGSTKCEQTISSSHESRIITRTSRNEERSIVQYGQKEKPKTEEQGHMPVNEYGKGKTENATIHSGHGRGAGLFVRTRCSGGLVRRRPHPELCRRPKPLLLWVKDGNNEQRDILKLLSHLNRAISVLSNEFGFGCINYYYAYTARDTVYWNSTREEQFSLAQVGIAQPMHTCVSHEIHPQTPMHTWP